MAEPRIRILPDEAINKVAAGEVVERPAAALKELCENALDAGATRIEIELERAGAGLIRVRDDGSGMTHDEALLALERHSTSKIRGVEDLARITSLGFRGEALPSLAAVSRMQVLTRRRGEPEGTRIRIEGGRIRQVSPAGAPEGTEVELRTLFFNVPARLKFLRSEATELGHCLRTVTGLALAHPAVAFRLDHGGRTLLDLPATSDRGARLREHLGRDAFATLIPFRAADGAVSAEGFFARPGTARAGAEHQQLFVNDRPVRDPLILQGLREAGRDYFLKENAGLAFYIWLHLPPDEVDVNVHPTKREVRFRNLGAVRQLLARELRDRLRGDRMAWLGPGAAPAPAPQSAVREARPLPAGEPAPAYRAGAAATAPPLPGTLPPPEAAAPPVPAAAAAPAPGAVPAAAQLFASYLVSLRPEGLVLVDQHAAHERILYDRLLARPPGHRGQLLLHPLRLELTAAEESLLEGLRPALEDLGIGVEAIGPRAFRLTALPPELPPEAAPEFVRELIARAGEERAPRAVEEFRHRAAAILACHGAVRANQRLGPEQIAALLRELAATREPGTCPHGRPTTVTLDRAEIEKRFKRC